MRHLMYLYGKQTGGPTGGRLEPALAFVEKMFAADARSFGFPGMKERFGRLMSQNRNYLAHEYFNDAWDLFYHSDIAADLAAARLFFLSSASLLDHVDAINLTADQQKILGETVDPVLRETLRDYMINQQFRRDIFARGTVPLTSGEAQEIWLDSRFALSTAREDIPLKVNGVLGEANLQEEVYGPLLDGFARLTENGRSAAISLRQLFTDNPRLAELGWARIQQAIMILVGAGHLQPCPADPKGDAKRRESTRRFNLAVMDKARYSADLQSLASPVTGGGIGMGRFEQLFLLALSQGKKEPAQWAEFAWSVISAQGQRLLKDGKPLEEAGDNLAELNLQAAKFADKRLPTLRNLQIA